MKKDVKIVKGVEVILTPGKACNKCVFFEKEHGDCSPDNWDCLMYEDNNDKVWRYAYPGKRIWKKVVDFFRDPQVKYCLTIIGGILVLLLLMAGESIINKLLEGLK